MPTAPKPTLIYFDFKKDVNVTVQTFIKAFNIYCKRMMLCNVESDASFGKLTLGNSEKTIEISMKESQLKLNLPNVTWWFNMKNAVGYIEIVDLEAAAEDTELVKLIKQYLYGQVSQLPAELQAAIAEIQEEAVAA